MMRGLGWRGLWAPISPISIMGETRVDLQHLLEDLRDAYTGAIEETVISEMVANSLDSGARTIDFCVSAQEATFTVRDDGCGMRRRELARYHDIAATTKIRGQGIGFAGVGIKLGLLVSEEAITETRRGKVHVATRWHLASRHRAPWKWVPPPGRIVGERGTAVTLRLQNPLSPLLDTGYIEAALRRHFQALFEPLLTHVLGPYYGPGISFTINRRMLKPDPAREADFARIEVKLGRKRNPSAVGHLFREPVPLAEERRGLAISTIGKVIRRGWDWLGISPERAEFVGGLIEAPGLAASLTLNKADFIRTGSRGAAYLAYRRAIQEGVSAQLSKWGDARATGADLRRRLTRPIERDLERVLLDLADDFPLIASLVEHRAGGQRKLPIGPGTMNLVEGRSLVAASVAGLATQAEGTTDRAVSPAESPAAADGGPDEAPRERSSEGIGAGGVPSTGQARRPQRYGLKLDFESRPGEPDFGRLIESTVWINESHPAYQRAVASRSEGYHLALAVAMTLAPLATEPHNERAFVSTFLAHWGEALRQTDTTGRRLSRVRRTGERPG